MLHLSQVAIALRKSGPMVSWITSLHSKQLPQNEDWNDISVSRIPVLFKYDRGVFIAHKLPLELFKHRNEHLIVALPFPEAGLVAILSFIFRIKVDVIYICTPSSPNKNIINRLLLRIVKIGHWLLLKRARKVGVSSLDYATAQKELKTFKRKIVACPPIIEFERFRPPSERIETKALKVGFVGRPTFEKGILNLLKAVEAAKITGTEIELHIVGPEIKNKDDPTRKVIDEFVTQNQKEIFIRGELTDRELEIFYQGIDVLVLPSIDPLEALGMVQIESMLSGTPVIASALPGVRLPVSVTGFGWLVEPGSDKDIFKILSNFEAERKKIEFDRESMINRLSSFLDPKMSLNFFPQPK